jgi:outer membrane autotransporter protein
LPQLRSGRRTLLAGTALASTLLISNLLAPAPASAQQAVSIIGSPTAIAVNNSNDCVFVGNCIEITTIGLAAFIDLVNSGDLTAGLHGINTATYGPDSPINIVNTGSISAGNLNFYGDGIAAYTFNANSPIVIDNSAAISAGGAGIFAVTIGGSNSPIAIENSAAISAGGPGIFAVTIGGSNSPVSINNSARIESGRESIGGISLGSNSPVVINNSGPLLSLYSEGIVGFTVGADSPISIINRGPVMATYFGPYGSGQSGVEARTLGLNSPISVVNAATVRASDASLSAGTAYDNSPIFIDTSGPLFSPRVGIEASSRGQSSDIVIVNTGPINTEVTTYQRYYYYYHAIVTRTTQPYGIRATTRGEGSDIAIFNSGDLTNTGVSPAPLDPLNFYARSSGIYTRTAEYVPGGSDTYIFNSGNISGFDDGIHAQSGGLACDFFGTCAPGGLNSDITIVNQGTVSGTRFGIYTAANSNGGSTTIVNNGDVTGFLAGIRAQSGGSQCGYVYQPTYPYYATVCQNIAGGPILINNAGTVSGTLAGISTSSVLGTTIINTGSISSSLGPAIIVEAGSADIFNAGLITGYVILDANDTFINQKGGVFETKLTSDFGAGSDLFRNEHGGTVLAATDPKTNEHSSFVGLERFENAGLITMQDGHEGDSFEISNTIGGRDLKFIGSGDSTLAIDAFLGGPGSTSDTFTINGDVGGKTKVKVDNTNRGVGVFNKVGIPVVYVNGNVKGDEFFLGNPLDTGFFNYDLFFRPTGSGVFELRSFLGQGAFVLPQLITSSQDIWHQTSDTWFDRTADLRVLLNGSAAPTAYDPNARYAEGAPQGGGNITPAVWVRGSGNWLDREDSQSVTAYGRSYQYNLNRDLETIDFQSGIDLGKRGLLSENDILVFGALGGFVHADLDYNAINRAFNYQGGQVGGYATYLRGGLFVDTLVNVHLMEIDTGRALGFPSSLDATTVGVRTDSGYRFGSFNGGAFIEPLATIAVDWAEIDGFSLGGNKVSFDDDANVRGRLGLRVGTSMQLWTGSTMEPFVIGSLWGNLSNDNQATLVSTGTTFILKDDLQDVWGEVSAGVNFFNPSANTSVFAKLDVTFGDDIDGVGGKAGMRVSW